MSIACFFVSFVDLAIKNWESKIDAELSILEEEHDQAFEDYLKAEALLEAPGIETEERDLHV